MFLNNMVPLKCVPSDGTDDHLWPKDYIHSWAYIPVWVFDLNADQPLFFALGPFYL